jgi:CubicO group peptidase (beta-lactamase class C family)
VYRIASISKPIAATAVMQLVERGVVSLDDPVQRFVPAFPRKPQGEVRLHHLLSHTAGIRHYKGREMESRERYADVASAVRIFGNDPLQFAPGTKYLYSTYGYNLLAGVVERASGLSYEQYLHERIFQPAGMTATALEHPDAILRFRARQYTRNGREGPLRNAPYVDLSNKWAGGGVVSTVLDLARFDIALNEGRLLTPGTLARMYTSTRLTSGQATGYGLGWMVVRDARGRTWVAHSGGATGGTTYLLRRPESRTSVALLSNVDNAEGLREIALQLAELAAGEPAASPRHVINPQPED